ncbi:ninjurin-2-like [Cimex lectularius]|uniref:Ninjurin n=1 Tax=Cimex lectularius TaxID=79782 RepID=A0A8I6RD55_CIMLE|nr:ninjurin-2-like [Cimex lectularius]
MEDLKEEGEIGMVGKKVPQYSTYAAKKTVAQGMMDIALITANANQLRYLIQFQSYAPTYYVTLTLIVLSIVLQVIVGLFLIFKGRYDLKGEEKLRQANIVNNYVVVGVFLITIINVFIASFSLSVEPIIGSNVVVQNNPALAAP